MAAYEELFEDDFSDDEINLAKGTRIVDKSENSELSYLPLKDILMGYPYKQLRNCHIFGIIVNYFPSNTELEIYDETADRFKVTFQFHNRQKNHTTEYNKKLRKELEDMFLKTGNIIRIHRLQLKNIMAICAYSNDIMLFDSNSRHRIDCDAVSRSSSITKYEIERVKALQKIHLNSLLNPTIQQFQQLNYVDFVCEIFHIYHDVKSDNYQMIGWAGKKIENYPSCKYLPNSSFQNILYATFQNRAYHLYSRDFIQHLYDNDQLIFINIRPYWKHIINSIEPFSVVTLHNVGMAKDNNGCVYTLYDNSRRPGRTIRLVQKDSFIDRAVRKRAMEYYKEFEESQRDIWLKDQDWQLRYDYICSTRG